MIEEKTIIKELREFVKKFTTNKQAANALKVTQAQLSTTLNGSVNVIPEKILKKLGYKSALVYLPLKAAKKPAEPAPKKAAAKKAAKKGEVKSDDAYLAGIQAKTEARQRQPVSPVVVTPVPAAREDGGAIFLDINARD